MSKIVLDLTDDEFLTLGAIAFGFFATGETAEDLKNPYGSLMAKIRAHIEYMSTPGQMLHFNKVAEAVRAATQTHEVDAMMIADGLNGLNEGMKDYILNG